MMNKRERAEVAELPHKREVLAALHWTEEVKPDVPVPGWSTMSKGFLFCDYCNGLLGFAKESEQTLLNAVEYLRRHKNEQLVGQPA